MSEAVEKVDTETAAEVGTACHMMLESILKAGVYTPAPPGFSPSDAWSPKSIKVVTRNDGSEHARLSPSAAERWTICGGSVALTSKVSESASRTVDVSITDEMVEWVEKVVLWVFDYLKNNPGCVLYSEERARAGVPFGCPDEMWGTADVVIVNRKKLELVVADAKFGYSEVAVHGNKQLTLYSIGLAHDFGWAFKTHRQVILQPRSAVPVKEAVLSVEQLQLEMFRLGPKVDAAVLQLNGEAALQLVPTDEGCKWCSAAGICPELQKRALQLARREFLEPELLSRDDLVLLLKEADRVRKGLNAAEAHAANLLKLGQPVPGFKLVRGEKRRVWNNPAAAGNTLVKLGVPYDDVWRSEMQFTPAQAEKKVGAHFKDLLQVHIEKPLGEATLVTEDDPRMPLPPEFEPC